MNTSYKFTFKTNKTLFFILQVLFLLSIQALTGQVRTIQMEDTKLNESTASPHINGIFQDDQGFIWIYSYSGLKRYDGYELVEYLLHISDTLSLDKANQTSVTTHFQQVDNNALWVGTHYGNIARLDRKNDRLVPFKYTKETKLFNVPEGDLEEPDNVTDAIFNKELGRIWVDNEEIWVSNFNGIYRLVPDTNTYHLPVGTIKEIHWYEEHDKTLEVTSSFYNHFEDSSGVDWIRSPKGLFEYHPESNKYEHYQLEKDTAYNAKNDFSLPSVSFGDSLLVLGSFGEAVTTFNTRTKELERHVIAVSDLGIENDINEEYFRLTCGLFIEKTSKKVWILAFPKKRGQIESLLFDIEENTFERVQMIYGSPPTKLKSLFTQHSMQDANGNIWQLQYDGIFKGSLQRQVFRNIAVNQKTRIYGNIYGSLINLDDSTLWFSDDLSITRFDRDHQLIESYPLKLEDTGNYKNNNDFIQIFHTNTDSDGNVWLGTGVGLCRFFPETGKYQLVEALSPFFNIECNGIGIDSVGNLWLCYVNKLVYYEPKTEQYTEYKFPEHSYVGTKNTIVDRKGNVWLGTFNGANLYSFDPSKIAKKEGAIIESLERFPFANSNPKFIDSKGNIWISTYSSGVIKINLHTRKTTQFFTEKGLAHNMTYGIIEDNNGDIWIGTRKGLSRLNPKSGAIKNFFTADGLNSDNFDGSVPYKAIDGELYFPTEKGIIHFYPNDIYTDTTPPRIAFTGFELFGEDIRIGEDESPLKVHISQTKEIVLPYWQNDMAIRFAALHYDNPDKNQYAVMLENYDKDWRNTNYGRRANYTNLSPGSYKFRVKASNSDGLWNEDGIALNITILPPPWKTWWAYLSYAAITIGLLLFARNQIINKEKLKNNLELEKVERKKMLEVNQLKNEFFANISHEFRTPLTLIQGPAQQLLQDGNSLETKRKGNIILRNTGRLLRLVNQLLDLSKLEAGKTRLEVSEDDFISFLKQVFSFFETTAEKRNITYMFHADTTSSKLFFDKEKLEKVFVNLLSNAFKFTPDGGNINIIVDTLSSEKVVCIKVKDSGMGIPNDQLKKVFDRFYQVDSTQTRKFEGTGIGLSLVKQLVEKHHGNITVESSLGKGSIFKVELPKGDKHFDKEELVSKMMEATNPFQNFENINITPIGDNNGSFDDPQRESLPSLLIVDDNVDMRAYIKENLIANFRIIEAENGHKGWEKALEKLPDLILSDVMMPEMDGFELCEKVKTEEATSHIPLILLTARVGEQSKITGLETGADDYIMKPFSPSELRVRIQNLIEQRQKLRDLFNSSKNIDPKKITVTSADERFLERVISIMEEKVSDPDFGAGELMEQMGMSRTRLYVKLKALTSQSISGFIRSYRLKYAAQLLEQDYGNISQIAYESGFNDHSYFSKSFKEHFGITPKEFISNLQKE